MKNIIISLILGLLSVSAYSQTFNCDSTCLGGQVSTMAPQINTVTNQKAQTVYGSNTVAMPATTSTSATKVTYGTCPSGFTYLGSSQYPISQQTTITYYMNGQITGTKDMPPQDLDSDCTAVEYQSVACPAGQTGSITQMRNVATGTGGYEYGSWTTTSNTCQASSGVWTWQGWNGGGGSTTECNYSVTVNGRTCNPVGYACLYRDDMTTKKGQYICK